MELRGVDEQPRRIRKLKMAHDKADWVAFRDTCEAALDGAGPPSETVQGLSTRLTAAIQEASVKFIPRGARTDLRLWALDPELREAVARRREARRLLRADDPESKSRWVEAKKHAAEVETTGKGEQNLLAAGNRVNMNQRTTVIYWLSKCWMAMLTISSNIA